MDIKLLETLCRSCGISGNEGKVRDLIYNQIKDYAATAETDNMGNLIVLKKGKKTPSKKLLVSAHMDEVGFIVTDITPDGYLKFNEVGGIDRRVVMGKSVTVGDKGINGVVCAKPVHLLEGDQRDNIPSYSGMFIDIGAKNREEAQSFVMPGDSVNFTAPFECYGGRIIGKAIDDRAGCLVMIEMIKSELEYDTYFSFVVQEEVGLRGAKCAAYTVDPDFAIVVESTTAADIPGIDDSKKVCMVGNGAVISFMDRSTIYDKKLVNLAVECGKKAGVKTQLKKAVAGGNDAGVIHCSRSGVRTAAVSLPCRYLHSNCGLIALDDLNSVYKTVSLMSEKILSGEF